MISIQLQNIDRSDAQRSASDDLTWVTLRSGEDRVVIHTHTFQQAVAIADAINSEREARS